MSEEASSNLQEQQQLRRDKLKAWRDTGKAYRNDFITDALAKDCHQDYGDLSTEDLAQRTVVVRVAGRIMTRRLMGKASFMHLQDRSGQLQCYVRRDDLAEGVYADFKQWDLGDMVGVVGHLFKTKTGELSVHVSEIMLLSKSLHPLPDKYHGLHDQEQRFRQRYLDLIANQEVRTLFRLRSQIICTVRDFLMQRDFLEVETPMMQAMAGGAAARPFATHHNALDMPLFLRVAPELYLKRLVVGGFDRVFEINRNFRNEGVSARHNPEFTMVEFYQAYARYEDMMDLTESMIRKLVEVVHGGNHLPYQGQRFDVSKPFARMTVLESICHYNEGITEAQLGDMPQVKALAESLGIAVLPQYGLGKIQIEIFEKTVEKKLQAPTFITAYPTEVSPLARANDDDPMVTDRFEFFVGGQEIANGFSELNDPEDQAARFDAQMKERAQGDDEAMPYDEDYITALEYAMPPTAGEGIGIDRLVMLLTDSASIRDVILFPLLRPKA